MSSKEDLCVHCGRFIAEDSVMCEEGGNAHRLCEYAAIGVPTKEDLIDLDRMIQEEEAEVEDHR